MHDPSHDLGLDDPRLVRYRAYVDGVWIAADDGATFGVTDPATGRLLADVASLGAAETARAIDAAERARPAWAARPAKERSSLLHRWHDLMLSHQEDLAVLMTREQGKVLGESRGEIAYGASFVEWFAEEAKRAYGDVIPAPAADRRVVVLKQPVGVVAAITPWNFPNAMITRKAGAALAAGCTVVLKPAEQTPLSALALAELAHRAGLPPGVFNVVTSSSPAAVGGVMTSSPLVRKLTFTGSTEVGKLLLGQAASTVKRASMELGGNAPLLVFDDADLDAAVTGAIGSKYRNSGQTCICANRILVHDAVHDAFVDRLVTAVGGFRVGNGLDDGVTHGPLIDEAALAKIETLVDDARERGATVRVGGEPHPMGGCFYRPTVLTEVTPEMRVSREEIFGPVAPVLRFRTEAEGIAMANDTPYGLAAYAYSRDVGRVWRVAEALEYGMVGMNEVAISSEAIPFGGMKESGLGREGSKYGLDEYLETKYVCLGGLDR